MGVHLGETFWLGHTRLSIVSPEHGVQPLMSKETPPAFAVVNGEVYNHLALRGELNIDPDVFTTQSDSEIVIHGYNKIGLDIVDKLIGMFAFVLVMDGGKDVIVARDKIGIKPLYMGKSKDGLEYLFASELKSIVDQCHAEDLLLVPAGHYWTRKTGTYISYYIIYYMTYIACHVVSSHVLSCYTALCCMEEDVFSFLVSATFLF
jgi:asparagine synthase (glutamine-hydrolysing)